MSIISVLKKPARVSEFVPCVSTIYYVQYSLVRKLNHSMLALMVSNSIHLDSTIDIICSPYMYIYINTPMCISVYAHPNYTCTSFPFFFIYLFIYLFLFIELLFNLFLFLYFDVGFHPFFHFFLIYIQ